MRAIVASLDLLVLAYSRTSPLFVILFVLTSFFFVPLQNPSATEIPLLPPAGIIQYVSRTKTSMLLSDACHVCYSVS
jgi:hypothetical protein